MLLITVILISIINWPKGVCASGINFQCIVDSDTSGWKKKKDRGFHIFRTMRWAILLYLFFHPIVATQGIFYEGMSVHELFDNVLKWFSQRLMLNSVTFTDFHLPLVFFSRMYRSTVGNGKQSDSRLKDFRLLWVELQSRPHKRPAEFPGRQWEDRSLVC